MMRRFSIVQSAAVLVATCAVCGCTGETFRGELPSDSTMVGLILDLHIAEARALLESSDMGPVRDSLFAAWGVDSLTYERTLQAFSKDPDASLHIYDRVLDSLNERSLRENRAFLPDSTSRIP